MGIKGWLTIGAGLVISAVYVIRRLQEENRREAKVARIIREVDCKGEKEEEPNAIDEMTDEIEQAFRDMGLDEKADAYAGAMDCLKNMSKPFEIDEIEKRYQNVHDARQAVLDLMEQKEEQTYDMIRNAVSSKDFTQMYNLFEQRYNKYPVQMSRAEAFGKASDEGLITKDILAEAQEFYGNLWFYVGD